MKQSVDFASENFEKSTNLYGFRRVRFGLLLVNYEVFRYMEIIEVVGIIAFVIAFITIAIRNKLEKGSFFPRA